MPITVNDLLVKNNLELSGTVQWGQRFSAKYRGIYIVSLFEDPGMLPPDKTKPIFNQSAIDDWFKIAINLTIDDESPTYENVTNRIAQFWFPDESILYIGKAEKQNIEDRVGQYFRHKPGKKSPHKGGFWVKLLRNVNSFYIHYAKVMHSQVDCSEKLLLESFDNQVSQKSRRSLYDSELVIPFANLEKNKGQRKKHGLSGQYIK